MTKKDLLNRLDKLIKLCEDTEPTPQEFKDIKDSQLDSLFTEDLIKANEFHQSIYSNHIVPSDKTLITDMMKQCNRIWKFRNNIKKNGWIALSSIEYRICELLKVNRKIEAIKIYREHKIKKDGDCGLREAKDYVDALQITLYVDKKNNKERIRDYLE